MAEGGGAGGQCLESERRFRGFVGQWTLRPLERGVVLLGICVCVCVCKGSPGGLSVIVLVRSRGVVLAGPHADGTSPCL